MAYLLYRASRWRNWRGYISRRLRDSSTIALGATGFSKLSWFFVELSANYVLLDQPLENDNRYTVAEGSKFNLQLSEELLAASASSWAHRAIDLASVMGAPPSRDELAAQTTSELLRVFAAFGSGQQLSLLREWREQDWLLGKAIVVEDTGTQLSGIAAGIDDDGALLVDTADGLKRIVAGSVRVEDH